jgi:sugar O-acyltransferase (sialic acid O-acetyltransferase NeuD family)
MRKLIIIGAGTIAKLAKFYFDTDSDYQTEAFLVDRQYRQADSYEGLPIFDLEYIKDKFSPSEYSVFVAISYAEMNRVRSEKYLYLKSIGYTFASYISSRCSWITQYEPGENCFILEDNTIQPFVKIGNNVTLWSGNHIGHDSVIGDHCFISSHVVISGFVNVGEHSFLGVNSTVVNNVSIAPDTFIGAGVVVTKDTEESGVYTIEAKAKKSKLVSSQLKL